MNKNLFSIVLTLIIITIIVIPTIGTSIFNKKTMKTFELESCEFSNNTDNLNIIPTNYTHTVFIGVATAQNCKPCHWWNDIIYEFYISGLYNFEYVEMIEFDRLGRVLNKKANEWSKFYDINTYPTSIIDGDYKRVLGNYSSKLKDDMNFSGIRTVSDIEANISVSWLGDARFKINISIENNQNIQYDGYIRAFITEIESRYYTYYGSHYHNGFLDFGFDKNISLSPGEIYTDSTLWDGNDHEDEQGNNFSDITEDNIRVTLVVYDNNTGYVDETTSATFMDNSPPFKAYDPSPSNGEHGVDINTELKWKGGDPNGDEVSYDVYFGESSNPQKIISNQSQKKVDLDILNFNTKYYWKIVSWDEHGLKSEGSIWGFTTTSYGDLEMDIVEPKQNSFYLRDRRLFGLPNMTFLYGPTKIKANATSSDGIKNVELYINGKLKENLTEPPYEFSWSPIICKEYKIKVIAYDVIGNQEQDEIIVMKWRAHPIIILITFLLFTRIGISFLR